MMEEKNWKAEYEVMRDAYHDVLKQMASLTHEVDELKEVLDKALNAWAKDMERIRK